MHHSATSSPASAAPVAAFKGSTLVNPDVGLSDGEEIQVGGLRLRFLHVPGHCPDHLIVYEPTWRLLITGDLLFVGKVGGTRSDADATTEWTSLQNVLARYPDDATVWPGHDYGARPSSTLRRSRGVPDPQARVAGLQAATWSEIVETFIARHRRPGGAGTLPRQ